MERNCDHLGVALCGNGSFLVSELFSTRRAFLGESSSSRIGQHYVDRVCGVQLRPIGAFAKRPFPLDWHILGLLRTKRGQSASRREAHWPGHLRQRPNMARPVVARGFHSVLAPDRFIWCCSFVAYCVAKKTSRHIAIRARRQNRRLKGNETRTQLVQVQLRPSSLTVPISSW